MRKRVIPVDFTTHDIVADRRLPYGLKVRPTQVTDLHSRVTEPEFFPFDTQLLPAPRWATAPFHHEPTLASTLLLVVKKARPQRRSALLAALITTLLLPRVTSEGAKPATPPPAPVVEIIARDTPEKSEVVPENHTRIAAAPVMRKKATPKNDLELEVRRLRQRYEPIRFNQLRARIEIAAHALPSSTRVRIKAELEAAMVTGSVENLATSVALLREEEE